MVLHREQWCRECERHGRPYVLATVVDHVIPRESGGIDALDNLQALCKSCHDRKTAKTDGGFGRASVTDDRARGCG